MRRIVVMMALLAGWMSALWAQQMTFNRLTTDDGLSQISVNSLYADENGLIWIATREGLNCYDGRTMKVFKLEKHNKYSLPGNTVTRLAGDGNGHLYLLCTEGVAVLDLHTLRFTLTELGHVDAIAYVGGRLMVARGNKITTSSVHPPTSSVHPSISSASPSTSYTLPRPSIISCMMLDQKGVLWVGTTNNGVFCFDKGRLSHPIGSGNITSIYEDSKGVLWIGTWNNGLFRCQHCADGLLHITNLRHAEGDANTLASDFVRTCCEDNEGKLWIGTFQGLNCYDEAAGTFQLYTQGTLPTTLSHQSVWCIVKDQQGTLWMGTYFGGVNYFNPEYEIFSHYRAASRDLETQQAAQGSGSHQGLSSGIVGRMTEDDQHRLWICTEGGGITVYDRTAGTYRWIRSGKGGLSENNVKAICYDRSRQCMWIGTHLGGLNRLDMPTGTITAYRSKAGDAATLPSDIIRDIVLAPRRTSKDDAPLIVATQNGVCYFIPATGKCEPLPGPMPPALQANMVASLCIDRQQCLWIAATGQGVYRFDLRKHTWKHYQHDAAQPHSLSSDNVNNIIEDSQGRIWLATGGCGLDVYRPSSDDFDNFDHQCSGIASDCIYQISESSFDKNRLLVITNQGLSVFDISRQHFVNYGKANGFPLSTVNENALYVTSDGEVFLGGVQGMMSFREQRLAKAAKPYRLFFSRLFVGGEEVAPGDATDILRESMPYVAAIALRHDQRTFSIDVSSTNHIAANETPLSYQLQGLNDEWTALQPGQHSVNFSNLPTGRYVLKLRAGRADVAPAALSIRILPPWYATWWARLVYLLAAGALVFWLVRNYRQRIRLAESLKYEQQHARDIEEMNQSKLRFFTNISHEIRTPLTLIVGHTEALMQSQRFLPAAYNKLLGIYRSCEQLRTLITELLDFRKQEQGGMQIHVSQGNLYHLVYETFLLFKEYAAGKHISLVMADGETDIPLWFDALQMQKVVNNLIINAIKHTPEGGSVNVRVWRDEQQAHFSVSDTGEGIAAADIDKIFDRFYQVEQLNSLHTGEGTGIGLALTKGIVALHHGTIEVESTVGKGSTFVVSLPGSDYRGAGSEERGVRNEIRGAGSEERGVRNESGADIHQQEYSRSSLLAPRSSNTPPPSSNTSPRSPNTSPRSPETAPRILIVEDNADLRQLLVDLFSPYYQITEAGDGEEAFEKLSAEMPDLVLSDVVMPRMTGTELCQKIKSDFSVCHIPVVLLTARTSIEYTLEGLKLGADDYVTKPFHSQLLLSRCNNLVNNRKRLQQKFAQQPKAHAEMLATTPIDKKLLDEAMALIEQHYADSEYSVDDFARALGMSRTALFTKWKSLTGQTPKSSIMNYRLQKAAGRLKEDASVPISEVAYACGFSSPRYFNQCFKEHFKMQPTVFREQYQS